jgi:hypothetical protein
MTSETILEALHQTLNELIKKASSTTIRTNPLPKQLKILCPKIKYRVSNQKS